MPNLHPPPPPFAQQPGCQQEDSASYDLPPVPHVPRYLSGWVPRSNNSTKKKKRKKERKGGGGNWMLYPQSTSTVISETDRQTDGTVVGTGGLDVGMGDLDVGIGDLDVGTGDLDVGCRHG